uniref:ANK_REP_REGION domain-containing protein n=1 Tax=Meloidogyne floridensis TaxID=298350 RepID=A0A915NC73_9BILA
MKELFDNCCLGYTQNVQLLLFKMSKKQNSRRSPLKFFRFSPSNDDSHFSNPPTGWLCNLRQPNTLHTLLHLAALHGHKEIVEILIEKDKQLIEIKDRRGCLPLHLAAWNGHLNILEILLDVEPKSVNEVNNSLQTALHLAVQNGHGPSILFILKKNGNPKMRNAHQENSLDIAVRTGRANLCRLLLMHCPELPVLSTSECCPTTPTHPTKSSSYSTPIYPLHIVARIGNEDCLKVLLENGFDTKYLGAAGTALHIAAINGNKNALKILLDNEDNLSSSSINVKNIEGLTVFELLNKQLNIFGSSNEKRIHERVRSWEECRNIILKYLSKEKREQIKSYPPCTTSTNSHSPKQTQPIRIHTKNDTSDNKTMTNTNIHKHSQAKSDCPNSTSADCPYQPLPDEIVNKLENNQQKNINGFSYQNLPKRSLLYDNAPLSAAGRRKWQHNCCHPPNGSSSNSPLPRAEMSDYHCSNSSLPHSINREFSLSTTQKNNKEESNNSVNREIEDDEGIRSLPVFSYNSITKLADSNKSSPESSEE